MIADLSIYFLWILYFAQTNGVYIVTISQRIFVELKKANRTQKDLADATGIPTSTISAWNKRGAIPSAEFIVPLAKELGVSVLYLLTGENSTDSDVFLTTEEKILIENVRKLDAKNRSDVCKYAENMAKLAYYEEAESVRKDSVS